LTVIEFIAKHQNWILPQFGVTAVGFHSEGGNRAMEEAFESARGKGAIAALYIETPANPTNGMVDLERARKIVSALHGRDGNRPVITSSANALPPFSCNQN
jgi:methionine-gamma-lyase